jgi:hypothetical protein
MRREHLAHLLRAASRIVERSDLLVVGSQSVLGTWDEDELPEAAVLSMEADLAVLDDPEGELADRISGGIGELSAFHRAFGYHADGVGVETAVLPAGWRDRLVVFTPADADPARGLCLEPHDCAVSKLVAGRPKDLAFVDALVDADLLQPSTLLDRIELLDERVPADARERLRTRIGARRLSE